MEVFTEISKNVNKILEDGQPVRIRFTGQLVLIAMTPSEQMALGFNDSKAIVKMTDEVLFDGDIEKSKSYMRSKLNKKKVRLLRKLKTITSQADTVSGLNDKLTTLQDL